MDSLGRITYERKFLPSFYYYCYSFKEIYSGVCVGTCFSFKGPRHSCSSPEILTAYNPLVKN